VPIYEYVCQSCQHRFEVKQGVTDPPLSSCERCGKSVTKVISAPAIMFKGTGWYVTDYSNKLKPSTESKPDEKGSAAPATAAPAASSSSSEPPPSPSTAGSDAPAAAPAEPSSSST
jgi:putative FmdB family regulatory protein